MPKIEFEMKIAGSHQKELPSRRPASEVLGIKDSGASRAGSTYYKSLLTCPFEWALKYVVGLSPERPSEPLTLGWLYHQALEAMYRTMFEHQQKCLAARPGVYDEQFFRGADSAAAQAAWNTVKPIFNEPGYEETGEVLQRILDVYITRFWGHDRWEILAVEENLEWCGATAKKPVPPNFDYTARLDLIVRDFDFDRRVRIIEHKTARAITADLIDNYEQDLQMLGQVWLLLQCVDIKKYGDFGGIVINIITKAKAPQALRHPASISKHHLKAFQDSMMRWNHYRRWVDQYSYPRAYGHCSGAARGYSKCQFYEVCHAYPQFGIQHWKNAEAPDGFVKLRKKKAA